MIKLKHFNPRSIYQCPKCHFKPFDQPLGSACDDVLLDGTKRFSEIRREIEGVSERMLSETLKQLEADGMLTRHSYNTVPPHTDYTLTEHGRAAGEKIYGLVDWLEHNLAEILQVNASGALGRQLFWQRMSPSAIRAMPVA